MFFKQDNFMFGTLSYIPEDKINKMKPVPVCTIIAALDEGNAVEQVAEQYGLEIVDIMLIIDYVQKNGTS